MASSFSPPAPSNEPCGLGLFIEPLSSSTNTKSTGVAQGGGGMGIGGGEGGEGGEGDGEGGDDGDGSGKQISHPALVTLASVAHSIGVPLGTTPSGEVRQ